VLLRDTAPARSPKRLLVAADAWACADAGVGEALRPALAKVTALIGAPESVTVGDEPLAQWMDYFRFPQGAEAWECHREWVTRVQPKFGPAVGPRFTWAATLAPQDVARARSRREEITGRMEEMLKGDAVLALPSISGIAPPRGAPAETIDEVRRRALPMLCISGLARLPQVSLPLATLDGCPLGLSLMAARGNDTMLLDLARKLM
jgi:amidase